MENKNERSQGNTPMHPDKLNQEKTDKEIREGAGSEKKENTNTGGLTKEDIPDSTNESTGKMGSGQRQDTN